MSRPQVSIDRLTPRRATIEPREAMNCKSCRKRKIKCNRLRPSCEACKVFQCACVYDAVPKKRGPKTDVLEALLKRVDGLEKRLQDENNPISPASPADTSDEQLPPPPLARRNTVDASFNASSLRMRPLEADQPLSAGPSFGFPSTPKSSIRFAQPSQARLLSETLLNTFFARLHGKPFFILDEPSTRQRYRSNELPTLSINGYCSTGVTAEQSIRAGLDTSLHVRRMVDLDNPTIDGLQTLLLLSQAYFAYGLSKKAYMTFSNCVAMVVVLDLFREAPTKANLPPPEREMRRRLFWTVYLMDRYINCGSRRPYFVSDHSILLRLPSASLNTEGDLFRVGPNIHYSTNSRHKSPSSASLLVDITRILGTTNRYLASGGVKGDSHFPWHALSTLSKIRQELDIWAAGTQHVFGSIEALFSHSESTTLLLSKLIYHLVHCLLFRPFLPIDLVELRGTGQHQSWQIEATNLCFAHSNAIVELVELGRNSALVEWPGFVAYCICTAGTVHIHGVHYQCREGEVFSSSAEFLAREMHQLAWLQTAWAGVQHQLELLQTIYAFHTDLVRNLASRPMRFSPVFHLEDFFDRYPGLTMDGAHVLLLDVGDNMLAGSGLVDQPGQCYQKQMPLPFQNQPRHDSGPRTQSLSSAETTEAGRQQSHPRSLSLETHNAPPQSSKVQLHQSPNTSQPSPSSLSFVFAAPGSAEQSTATDSAQNTHLHPPHSFSPSAFGFSPSPFMAENSFNIAPTPPSNPQYANFPL
ncbi:hypothetical protein N7468_003228 [Penicillium chermesinum]|uniref:Zn(2)-C6 fungal-type domain-containing protein n=1 Tax=Penicillium chermesinum TaxID=63820 RepID=A0A9W9P613_9EURO|nr:uncharacterized protein N7468_003228 [Penicillium chermesinum]KAJ5238609.1 hypothetical protein N7468_003228 [Penicillium chermesinum]